jgi:Ca2+-dependent lipid-binding protein
LQENLEFVVANYHRGLSNGVIGRATFPLSVLASEPIRTGEERPILKNTTEVNGTLLFDVFYYPILHSDLRKELRSTSRTPSFFSKFV